MVCTVLLASLVLGAASATVAEEPPRKPVQEAITALEPLRGDPRAPVEKLTLLGVLYLETGRTADAFAVLAPLARSPAATPVVLYQAGRAALALGQPEVAEPFLARSIAAAPASPARRELGLLRGRQGRAEDAYGLLAPWCGEHSDDLEACRGAAALALGLARTAEAEQLLAKLPRERPGVRLLWVELLLQKEDGPGALALVEPLLAQHPPVMTADVTRLAADVYLRNGRPADAVAVLAGTVGEDARRALLLARAHYELGDPERALAVVAPFAGPLVTAAEGALPLATATGLLREYGRLLVTLGRPTEAVPVLERLTGLDASDRQGWQLLGQALAASGRRAEAEAALAEFQRLARQP